MQVMTPTEKTVLGWDAENWSLALRLWDPHVPQGFGNCLELGCGPGGISLWLASKGNHVVCSDIKGPSESARDLHRLHGVSKLVNYQEINAIAIPYREQFDIIAIKSVLGGILAHYGKDGLHLVIQEVHKALKPGGKLLFAENLQATSLHMYCRRQFLGRDASQWIYPSLEEFLGFLAPFPTTHYQTAGFLGAFGRREWQRTMLGHIDKVLVPILPTRARYLVAGVAAKKQ